LLGLTAAQEHEVLVTHALFCRLAMVYIFKIFFVQLMDVEVERMMLCCLVRIEGLLAKVDGWYWMMSASHHGLGEN
jgi:hypothetical protein